MRSAARSRFAARLLNSAKLIILHHALLGEREVGIFAGDWQSWFRGKYGRSVSMDRPDSPVWPDRTPRRLAAFHLRAGKLLDLWGGLGVPSAGISFQVCGTRKLTILFGRNTQSRPGTFVDHGAGAFSIHGPVSVLYDAANFYVQFG